jgi:hypothetical protein
VDEPGIREQRLRQILRDLERSLSHLIAESPEIGESLRRIHDEGFELQMVFECKSTPDEQSADEAPDRAGGDQAVGAPPPARRAAGVSHPWRRPRVPAFDRHRPHAAPWRPLKSPTP